MRNLVAIAAFVGLLPAAQAQVISGEQLRERADELVRSVAETFDCEISILGEPHAYELSIGWYVAYSAAGEDCDAAGQALNGAGRNDELSFSRRPNLGQLRALVAEMVYAAGSATGCRINVYGEPRLNEATSQWLVTYRASGINCEEAGLELRRRGAELEISFMGRPDQPSPEIRR
jgi:hypothetical protein